MDVRINEAWDHPFAVRINDTSAGGSGTLHCRADALYFPATDNKAFMMNGRAIRGRYHDWIHDHDRSSLRRRLNGGEPCKDDGQ
jgi:hypothetical protein